MGNAVEADIIEIRARRIVEGERIDRAVATRVAQLREPKWWHKFFPFIIIRR
jgi:hypothetical protein